MHVARKRGHRAKVEPVRKPTSSWPAMGDVVRDAYSRRGVFDDGSGSDDDDVERCLRAVAELEDRVERLGADSDANDLLRAVAELRVVRGRYNDSLERRSRRARLRPATSPRPASRSPP